MQSFEAWYGKAARRQHAYPPTEIYRPLPFERVLQAWRAVVQERSSNQTGAPVGVYAHVPFCERKCSFCYCDTVITRDGTRVQRYLDALHKEIDLLAPALQGQPVSTIYLGGGTPTWLAPGQLDELLGRLAAAFQLTRDVNVNIEGTPRSITPEMAAVLRRHRTTRMTLGIQSTDESILVEQNRPQSLDQVREAVELLRTNGVRWINFDLVGGLPNDTPERFQAGFARLLAIDPDMVHVYPYTEQPDHAPNAHKQAIIDLSERMLTDHGYRPLKNDGWGRDEASRNQQVIDKVEHAGSCLGLGIRSRSHLFGQLAYRSQTYADWQEPLLRGEPPQYQGMALTKTLQIQRYLLDNLQQGLSLSRFRGLFGGDGLAYLRARHPGLVPHLKAEDRDTVRLVGAMGTGNEFQLHLFDNAIRDRMFSAFVGQPNGWPEEKMKAARGEPPFAPDLNWCSFLAMKLSKGNTYPPIDPVEQLTETQVFDAWRDLVARIKAGKAMEAIGLYCHVPWCASICKFCFCYKHLLEKPEALEKYVDAVIDQMDRIYPIFDGIRFNSIYFGGGTPSILNPDQIDRLLGFLKSHFAFTDDHQFNLEGTAATLAKPGRLEAFARHGVNRLTIGIQSLERHLLDDMNRPQQNKEGVRYVLQHAREVGIRYLNTDLLAGLPNQTFDDFKRSLDQLIEWRPDTIHVYPFQPTPETTYWQEGFQVTPEIERERGLMMQYYRDAVLAAGYKEIPNEAYSLSEGARNRQDAEKIEHDASILPLGYNARGHIFGGLGYGNHEWGYRKFIEDRSHTDFYYGLPVTLEDEMIRFIISNLRSGIDRERFHLLFQEDVLDRFWRQIWWLQEKGYVKVERTRIVSNFTSSAETVLLSKIFFAEKWTEFLRERFKRDWLPDYDWQAEFRKLYERSF
jgi:oxygen-independent coproporphyrinogen-3 oxidase